MVIKMNIFCFLISLAFESVLAVTYADYKKEFAITNKHIELVGDRLPDVIRCMIFGHFQMEKIAYMVAAPTSVNYRTIPKLIRYETDLRIEIMYVTSIPVPVVENPNIGWIDLGKDRISRINVALQAIIATIETGAHFALPIMICRLKGMLLSINQPSARIIKNVKLDDAYNCVLTAVNNDTYILTAVWEPSMASILHSSEM
ncbi:uncharacterized protein LOC126841656 isoform X2 [Adelges cooleyi]|uniref:uncharacterized protein LOC126841656 isoform X2 n=1 Tax=Adelges cooleyi TaxID=133065 RepID=UPI00217FEE3A|nr:uncharacterized protein LOC126841656 isoform X2 [Adelges cooleyi]